MEVTKIRFKSDKSGEKTAVTWIEQTSSDVEEEHLLISGDARHPDFDATMQEMVPEVGKMLGLPPSYMANVVCIGITITLGDDVGTVITCSKKLACGTLVLNTPHTGDVGDRGWQLISNACEEAKGFAMGIKRAQMSLFDEAAESAVEAVA